jgi:hypothetical protein
MRFVNDHESEVIAKGVEDRGDALDESEVDSAGEGAPETIRERVLIRSSLLSDILKSPKSGVPEVLAVSDPEHLRLGACGLGEPVESDAQRDPRLAAAGRND